MAEFLRGGNWLGRGGHIREIFSAGHFFRHGKDGNGGGQDCLSRAGKVGVKVFPDEGNGLAKAVAREIADLIIANNEAGKKTVLGLPTGNTPLDVYRELVRLHVEEGLDFSNVVTFNLDEYYGIPSSHINSYYQFMWENFFSLVNIKAENVHIPDGTVPRVKVHEYCGKYEQMIMAEGGLDLALLGIGRNGHIGFNEAGSPFCSRTRLVSLDESTRRSALPDFGERRYVPKEAITMGIATMLEAKRVICLATGEHKAGIVQKSVEGEVNTGAPASVLQMHGNAQFYLDKAAASELAQEKSPWLAPGFVWGDGAAMRAICMLSVKLGKPLLSLSEKDLKQGGLSDLASEFDLPCLKNSTYNSVKRKIFTQEMLPKGETIVVFSPHPDDDIISMGATLRMLVENGNRVIVVYMTPGNTAVFDHAVEDFMLSMMLASSELGGALDSGLCAKVLAFLEEKKKSQFGMPDIPEVLKVKKIIRQVEAISTCRLVGVAGYEFLNPPFYQTGRAKKLPISNADVDLVESVLLRYRPDRIFAAGDLTDPNGTHRLCLAAIKQSLLRLEKKPEFWIYSGAWNEFHPTDADVLVPFSAEQAMLKREGIFRHESQKDTAPQPGHMSGEFWQMAEKRNRATAQLLEVYGLGKCHAMEAFRILEKA